MVISTLAYIFFGRLEISYTGCKGLMKVSFHCLSLQHLETVTSTYFIAQYQLSWGRLSIKLSLSVLSCASGPFPSSVGLFSFTWSSCPTEMQNNSVPRFEHSYHLSARIDEEARICSQQFQLSSEHFCRWLLELAWKCTLAYQILLYTGKSDSVRKIEGSG